VVGVDAIGNVPLLSNLCTGALQDPKVIIDQPVMSTLRVNLKV
jgi:hypothetical protein